MVKMSKFGIDISTWQDGLDYKMASNQGVKFAILRAGFSTTKDNIKIPQLWLDRIPDVIYIKDLFILLIR